MSRLRLTYLVLLGAALLILPGCVELTGQRITWFYDSLKDELQILIHYDGIHDSGSSQHGEGAEQIAKFVANGDVMILDWPLHLDMADLRTVLQDESKEPLEKDWARLITSIKTQPVGYYREPDGRLGAVQLVTIPKAKDFLRRLNGLINKQLLQDTVSPSDPMARTIKRIQAAAKEGHQWITLDGHAIRVVIPVHPDEWARQKGEFLDSVARSVAKALGEKAKEEDKNMFRCGLALLTSAPLSYIDQGDRVEFVLGRSKKPSTVRLDIRNEYETSLEKVVADSVKVDLDKTLAEALLDKQAKPSAPLSAILSWGPPEERVRALTAAAGNGDQKQKETAVAQLQSWAERWNRDHGVPQAPQATDKPNDYLAAWKKWYASMKRYPTCAKPDDGKEPDASQQ